MIRLRAQGRDVTALDVNPPQHADVFAVDEKTAIQPLDRLDLVLPLSRDAPSDTGSTSTVRIIAV